MLSTGIVAGGYGKAVGGVKEGLGQTRGMKVRSSVKKLCEGCKVCLDFSFRRCWGEGRCCAQEWGWEMMGREAQWVWSHC